MFSSLGWLVLLVSRGSLSHHTPTILRQTLVLWSRFLSNQICRWRLESITVSLSVSSHGIWSQVRLRRRRARWTDNINFECTSTDCAHNLNSHHCRWNGSYIHPYMSNRLPPTVRSHVFGGTPAHCKLSGKESLFIEDISTLSPLIIWFSFLSLKLLSTFILILVLWQSRRESNNSEGQIFRQNMW